MIHLFNATWTSRGERRTIGIYRKLGPDLGRIVNNFIDGLGNLKQGIKAKLKVFIITENGIQYTLIGIKELKYNKRIRT